MAKALAYLLDRVADITLPDETLTPPSAPRGSGTAKWSRPRAAS